MKWGQILKEWENGYEMQYNIFIKNKFFYECSPYENDESEYKYALIENSNLNNINQDCTPFNEYIRTNYSHYTISFYNLSKTAKLIIPTPIPGKNFTTLKDFIDNAPKHIQHEFWKHVAREVRQMKKQYNKVWVSTHGLEIGYLHMIIDSDHKYYCTDEFK